MNDKSSLNVLLIEDNPVDALLLQSALETDRLSQFNLTRVERLAEGLRRLEQEEFDIALVDLGLPDSAGLETFTKLHKQFPDLPLVVFSGNEDEDQAIRAVRAGAQDYLVKSVSGFEMVPRTIRYAIERQSAQSALRESEERFSKIFEASPIGIILSQIEDGRILDVNDAFLEIFGREHEEVIGNTTLALNFYPDPGDRARLMSMLREQGRVFGEEMGFRRSSGEIGTLYISAEIIDLPNGRALLSMMVDITERKQAEAALKAEQLRFEQVAATVPGAITMLRLQTDGQMNLLYASKSFEEVFGLTLAGLSENVGDIIQRVPVEEIQRILSQLQKMSASLTPLHIEFPYRHPTKEEIWLENHAQPVREADGSVTWYGVTNDITERKQAEDRLKESEERFSTAFFTNPVAQSILSLTTGQVLEVNNATCHLYEYNREELVGVEPKTLNLWVNPAEQLAALDELQRTGHLLPREVMIRRKSGGFSTVLFAAEPITWKGTPCLITSSVDITERKQAENALRESEQRFTALFRSNPIPVGFTRASDYSIVDVNSAWTSLTGYTREESLGKTSTELGLARPETLSQLRGRLGEQGKVGQFEIPLCTRSGQERSVLISSEPLELGGETYFLNNLLDITERKQAEEKIRQSEALLRQVLESTPDSIFAVDRDYRLLVNNERHQQVLVETGGHPLQAGESILPPDYLPEVLEHWRGLYDRAFNGEEFKWEAEWPYSDGQLHTIESHFSPLRDANGTVTGALVVISDITERKQAELDLHEKIKLQEQLEKTSSVAPGLICSFKLDPNGQYSMPYASPAIEDIYGLRASEVARDTAPSLRTSMRRTSPTCNPPLPNQPEP